MRTTLLLMITLTGFYFLPAQKPGEKIIPSKIEKIPVKKNTSRVMAEVCNNNIDDDGNGLKDCEDYSCYYSSPTVCNCALIDVIWIGNSGGDLLWVNHKTGVETKVGNMGMTMADITWSPDGNLYGVDINQNKIWRINPATAQVTFVANIPGYDVSNALTADASGNLYIASVTPQPNGQFHIIRLNPTTGVVTFIANLTAKGLTSSGDLAFYNGLLYVSCDNAILANVNVATGAVNSSVIIGFSGGARGLVIKSDGTAFLSSGNRLYKLDISTMQASLYYTCTTAGVNIWGMANFNEYCVTAPCNASVEIFTVSNQPYCINAGVQLRADGSGLTNGVYKWRLPDGSTATTQTITATKTGKYIARYSTDPDNCGAEDTIDIKLINPPNAKIGNDTVLCKGTSITFKPVDTADVTSYLWNNGSTGFQMQVNQPGIYWLQTSNACGTYRDSILVTEITVPDVDLGPALELCENDTLHLRNLLDRSGYIYRWSDNTTGKFMVVNTPGKYWVDVTNNCGTQRDSIVITGKTDGCGCTVYIPTAFTPNNDGKNDLFKVTPSCPIIGELLIYNRWGQLIYKTKDLQNGWNGIYNSIPQTTGVFVYHIKYSYTFQPGSFTKKGSFVLIR